MKAIYIDHNILVRERNWPILSSLLAENIGLRLVISDWNLLEITSANDKTQAVKRAEFIDSLNPLWIMERRCIQQHEVKRFIWLNYFNCQTEFFCVFTEYLSVLLSYFLGEDVPLGCTAKKWVENVHGRIPLTGIDSAKTDIANALKTLQSADKKKKTKLDADAFRAWVLPTVPDRGPENEPIPRAKKQEIVEFCYVNKDKFYLGCPAMAVEDTLSNM